ncbi:MAG: hypothetical protein LUH40_03780 [Clostridiales bacterium]|nr:hypothetical protein [Clostridiales bacterium]
MADKNKKDETEKSGKTGGEDNYDAKYGENWEEIANEKIDKIGSDYIEQVFGGRQEKTSADIAGGQKRRNGAGIAGVNNGFGAGKGFNSGSVAPIGGDYAAEIEKDLETSIGSEYAAEIAEEIEKQIKSDSVSASEAKTVLIDGNITENNLKTEIIPENEAVTAIIDENDLNGSDATEKNADKKDKSKKYVRKKKTVGSEGDSTTKKLLDIIFVVGVCLLAVSIVGIVSAVGRLTDSGSSSQNSSQSVNTAETTQTTAVSVENITSSSSDGEDSLDNADSSDSSDNSAAAAADFDSSDSASTLEFFNTAVNKIKTDGPSFTKAKQTETANIDLSNSLAQAYVSTAEDKYLSSETVTTEISKGDTASAIDSVSPDGASYVSALTTSDIQNISVSQNSDGNYVIKVEMADTTNPDESSSYAKIFQFMTVDDVMDTYAPDMGATVERSNVSLVFSGCYAQATITPDGQVTEYTTYVKANMILTDAKISIVTTDLDATLISSTSYTDFVW